MKVIEKTHCRICKGGFRTLLDLGLLYPSEFIENAPSSDPQPLVLVQCESCGLVQLKHSIDPDAMYRQYWYRSSLNQSMVRSLNDIISGVEQRVSLEKDDVVLDIGANDGTLLSLYTSRPIRVGFDPAKNLAQFAKPHCNYFINNYFNAAQYPLAQKAKVITSIAMFYDLDEPRSFIEDVRSVLAEDGIWVIQMTDLVSMLKANAFDNLCMEHLEYYSVAVLNKLLSEHKLDLFDIEFNMVNGGSIRAYVAHRGKRKRLPAVDSALSEEAAYLSSFEDPFLEFQHRVLDIKNRVTNFVREQKKEKSCFYVLGASTKGNTLLQYFKLENDLIDFAAEVNPEKFGKKTAGTNILIIPEGEALANHPDYCLVLPWHFINNFIERNQCYLQQGGKFLIPLPEPAVISSDGWQYL